MCMLIASCVRSLFLKPILLLNFPQNLYVPTWKRFGYTCVSSFLSMILVRASAWRIPHELHHVTIDWTYLIPHTAAWSLPPPGASHLLGGGLAAVNQPACLRSCGASSHSSSTAAPSGSSRLSSERIDVFLRRAFWCATLCGP